jgi:hypothetical protein
LVDLKILRRALLVGAVFELLLVAAGHFKPWLRPYFLFGAMLVAGLMVLLYARDLARGFASGALGGAAAGVLCGLVAVLAAHYLGERPDLYLPWGVAVCALTGAAGGLFGQLDAMIQSYLRRLR